MAFMGVSFLLIDVLISTSFIATQAASSAIADGLNPRASSSAIADGLNPLTMSHTARTISCTAMGMSRSVYPVTGLLLNKANKHAANIRMGAAIQKPDSQRGTSRD